MTHKIICPRCKRKFDLILSEEKEGERFFRLPEHENYTKTAACPASGKCGRFGVDFPLAGGDPLEDVMAVAVAVFTARRNLRSKFQG